MSAILRGRGLTHGILTTIDLSSSHGKPSRRRESEQRWGTATANPWGNAVHVFPPRRSTRAFRVRREYRQRKLQRLRCSTASSTSRSMRSKPPECPNCSGYVHAPSFVYISFLLLLSLGRPCDTLESTMMPILPFFIIMQMSDRRTKQEQYFVNVVSQELQIERV